jgi:hypothetical protein
MVEGNAMADAGTRPEQTLPAIAQRHYMRAEILPLGGSARARLFAGPRAITVRGRAILAYENAMCLPDGQMRLGNGGLPVEDATVLPLSAGPGVALGDFCATALPGILAATACWPEARLAGAAPMPTQLAVLERLGIAPAYRVLATAQCFATVLMAREVPAHAAPADADYLALMAHLRDPPAANVPEAVAILPSAGQRFTLRNRASLSAWLRARRFRILEPDAEAFTHVAATMARATLVLLAEPGQAGLLGLCPPGTQVLEIAPEGWAGSKTRAICDALGLRWNLFLAGAPAYPVLNALPLGATSPLAYEVAIPRLGQALGAI